MSIASVLNSDLPYHAEHSRAEAFMDAMPNGCASLIFADLPYFGVKGDAWDNAWADDAAFLRWVADDMGARFARVLASNGSLYVCASPRLGSRVEVRKVTTPDPRQRTIFDMLGGGQ